MGLPLLVRSGKVVRAALPGDHLGAREQALKPFIDYMAFPGAFDQMPETRRAMLMDNLREFEALAYSTDDVPLIPRAQLREIKTPTLMLSGANTVKMNRLVDHELAQLLPQVERVTIQGAGHSMWRDNPTECSEKTLAFLARQRTYAESVLVTA